MENSLRNKNLVIIEAYRLGRGDYTVMSGPPRKKKARIVQLIPRDLQQHQTLSLQWAEPSVGHAPVSSKCQLDTA